MRRQEPPLDFGVVGDAGRRAEQLLVDAQVDRRLVVRGGHEDGLVRRDPDAEHGRRVQVGEEDQDVVVLLVALEVLEERRAPGTLLASAIPSRPRACAAR